MSWWTSPRAAGIRFVGPNTAGFVDFHHRFAATISMVGDMQPFVSGGVAFITQSGALGGSMLGRGMEQGVGFSHWVTTGNQADLSAADYLDHLVDDPDARVFALFLESVSDPPRFLAACAKAARAGKPVVVYKSGASSVGAASSASHTGALAGSHKVFSAMCRQHGLIQVDDVADLLPLAKTFAWLGERFDLKTPARSAHRHRFGVGRHLWRSRRRVRPCRSAGARAVGRHAGRHPRRSAGVRQRAQPGRCDRPDSLVRPPATRTPCARCWPTRHRRRRCCW